MCVADDLCEDGMECNQWTNGQCYGKQIASWVSTDPNPFGRLFPTACLSSQLRFCYIVHIARFRKGDRGKFEFSECSVVCTTVE